MMSDPSISMEDRARRTLSVPLVAPRGPITRVVLALCFLLTGCGLIRGAATSAGLETARHLIQVVKAHPDPELVEQGLPTFLLLLDSLAAQNPDDLELRIAAANGYLLYAQAFLTSDEQSERSALLHLHARQHALSCALQNEAFQMAFEAPIDEYRGALQTFTPEDAPTLHALAASWLGWIVADSDSMEALADLPRALGVAERALEVDSDYGDGSGHLVFGIFYAAQPPGAGQDLEKSRRHFDQAIEIAGPGILLPRVLRAEFIGKATLDLDFFVDELEKVLEADSQEFPENLLLNRLSQQRARQLLASRDEYF